MKSHISNVKWIGDTVSWDMLPGVIQLIVMYKADEDPFFYEIYSAISSPATQCGLLPKSTNGESGVLVFHERSTNEAWVPPQTFEITHIGLPNNAS